MPTVLQFRRGTTAQNNAFTGAVGEISIDTTIDTIRIHDGSTAGGFELTANAATQTLTNKTLDGAVVTTSFTPSAADGAALGSATAEWSDLFLADGGIVNLGSDQDVTITHVADTGINLKNNSTDGNSGIGAVLTLQTGDTDIASGNVLGEIAFQAPDEAAGTDAILVAAGIAAVSEGDFAADNNATKLSFRTGASETATEKMSLSSAGNLTVTGTITATATATLLLVDSAGTTLKTINGIGT